MKCCVSHMNPARRLRFSRGPERGLSFSKVLPRRSRDRLSRAQLDVSTRWQTGPMSHACDYINGPAHGPIVRRFRKRHGRRLRSASNALGTFYARKPWLRAMEPRAHSEARFCACGSLPSYEASASLYFDGDLMRGSQFGVHPTAGQAGYYARHSIPASLPPFIRARAR